MISFIMAFYSQQITNKYGLPYALDGIAALFMVVVSPALFTTGITMYLYGRKKEHTLSSPTPPPVSLEGNIVEKPKSSETLTNYQKASIIISITSIIISILLRILIK